MMAHMIECHLDHEIVMASALPKPIPLEATVSVVLIIFPFSVVLDHTRKHGESHTAHELCRIEQHPTAGVRHS
jgi:hypothetical protein